MKNKDWDFFMFVEIGVDRIQHAFWKFMDSEHHLYQPKNKYENVIRDYYRFLDRKIGNLLTLTNEDTIVLIVSDHGAKRMKGAFCINEWLIKKGYLTLKSQPEGVISLDEAKVDWHNTKAWGWGGYYARVFLNVEGREQWGIIKLKDYEKERKRLGEEIKQIKGPNGEKWKTKVFKPEEIYADTKGDPPDLMVYFDDLYWRSAGTIGHNSLFLSENDIGPDDAVHSEYGIFIMYDPHKKGNGKIKDIDILDVAPTILDSMGMPVPEDITGKIISYEF